MTTMAGWILVQWCAFQGDSGESLPSGAVARAGSLRLRHGAAITAIAFTPDGKQVAAGDMTHEVRIWDTASGRLIRAIQPKAGIIRGIALSPDGGTIAIATGGNTFGLWNVKSGERVSEVNSEAWAQFDLSPDGKTVAVCKSSGTIQLLDPSTGDLKKEVGQGFQRVRFSRDGKVVAYDTTERKVTCWNVESEKGTSLDLPGNIFDFDFSPDGETLAVGCADRTIRFMSLKSGKETGAFRNDRAHPIALRYSPNGKTLAFSDATRLVLWDVGTSQSRHSIPSASSCIAISADDRLVAWSDGQRIRLAEADSGKELCHIAGHKSPVKYVAIDKNGSLVTGADDFQGRWDASNGKLIESFRWESPLLAVSLDETTAATRRALIRLWTGETIKKFPYSATASAFSSDGKTLAIGGEEGKIDVFTPDRELSLPGLEMKTPSRAPSHVTSVCFSKDGKILAASGLERTVRLYDAVKGTLLRDLGPESMNVYELRFSADGKSLAAGCKDSFVRIFDVELGTLKHKFSAHSSSITHLIYLQAGHLLAACHFDSAIHVWDLATTRVIYTFQHDSQVFSLAASNRLLVSGHADGTALEWSLDVPAKAAAGRPWCEDLSEEQGNKVFEAMQALILSGDDGVRAIEARVKTVSKDRESIDRVLAQLDDEDPRVRARAFHELAGADIGPILRDAFGKTGSAEVRQGIQELLKILENKEVSPGQFAGWRFRIRATHVLEMIGSPRAKEVLRYLAEEVPWKQVNAEAKSALGPR